MSIRNKIMEFYSDLLKSLMVSESKDTGSLVYQISPDSDPTVITIGEKMLRLPRAEYMREPNDDYMYFHPMGEDVSLGESPVFQQLTNLVVAKLTLALMSISSTVIKIGNLHSTGADVSGKLTAKQVELIAAISGTDNLNDKIADKFSKVVAAATKDPATRPIKITIRRNAKRYGEETVYRRAAIVTFPLLTEIIKKSNLGEDTIHGQKFAKYEMRLMVNIYKALFPGCDADDHYSVFSDSPHAPNFTALLLAYAGMSQSIAKAARAFEAYLPDHDYGDVDWQLEIAKIPEYASVIPTARGNEGVVLDDRGQLVSRDYDEPVRRDAPVQVREVERTTREERGRYEEDDRAVRVEDRGTLSPLVTSRDGRFAAIPLSATAPVGRAVAEEEPRARSSASGDLAQALRDVMNQDRHRSRDLDDDDDDDYYDRRGRRDSRDSRDRERDRGRDSRSSRYRDDDDYDDRPLRRDFADDYHRSALRSRAVIDDRDDRTGRHRSRNTLSHGATRRRY